MDDALAGRIIAGLDAASGHMVLLLDAEFEVIWATEALRERLGPGDVVGRNALEVIHPDDVELAAEAAAHHALYADQYVEYPRDAHPQPSTIRVRSQTGEWVWTEVVLHNLLADPEVGAIVVHMRLDTDRPLIAHAVELLSAGAGLVEVLRQLAAVIEVQLTASTVAVVWWEGIVANSVDADGEALTDGPAVLDLCERARRSEQTLIIDDFDAEEVDPALAEIARARGAIRVSVIPVEGSVRGDVIGCALVWSQVPVPPLMGIQTPVHLTLELIALAIEDDGLKRRLRADAEADPLTEVYNRAGFRAALSAAVDNGDFPLGIVFVDLDEFKAVNDRFGHMAGDRVLVTVAARLADLDPAISVGRMGGDEFALLLPRMSPEQVGEIARRAVEDARTPIPFTDGQVAISVTAGYACAGAPGHVATLLARADEALLTAKRAGKSRAYGHPA